MKVSIVREIGGVFETVEARLDQPKDYEVRVKVKASGLCHSDLNVQKQGMGCDFPVLLGHEIAGIVEQVGDKVTDFEVGDHVSGCMIQFCGHCMECLSGRTYLCEHPQETLRRSDDKPRITFNYGDVEVPLFQAYGLGGFAEEVLVHQNQLAKIPKEVPFDRACVLGCGTITGAGAIINTADVRPGDYVAIIGTGGVGLNAIAGAKIAGASIIIAVDISDEKLEFAKRFGATHFVNSTKEDPIKRVREITKGGVHAAFEAIGLVPTALQAVSMARRGGGAYLIGIQKPKSELPIKGFESLVGRGVRVVGVWLGSTNLKRDIPTYANLYLQGRMNLDDLVSKTISLDQINEGFQELQEGKVLGRLVVTF